MARIEQWRPHIQLPRDAPLGPWRTGKVAELPNYAEMNENIHKAWMDMGKTVGAALQVSEEEKNLFGETVGGKIKQNSQEALERGMSEIFYDMEWDPTINNGAGGYVPVKGSGKHWDELSAAEQRVQNQRMAWAQQYKTQIDAVLQNVNAGQLNLNNINWSAMKDHNNFAAFMDHIATNTQDGAFDITFDEYDMDWDEIKKMKAGFLGIGADRIKGKTKRQHKKGYKSHSQTGIIRYKDKNGQDRTITLREIIAGQKLFITNEAGKDFATKEFQDEGKLIDADLTSIHKDLSVKDKQAFILHEAFQHAKNFELGFSTGDSEEDYNVDYGFIYNNMILDPKTGFINGYSNPNQYMPGAVVTDKNFDGVTLSWGGSYKYDAATKQVMYTRVDANGDTITEPLTQREQVENFVVERILDNVRTPWKFKPTPTGTGGGGSITGVRAFVNQEEDIRNRIDLLLYNINNKGAIISKKDPKDFGEAEINDLVELVNEYTGNPTELTLMNQDDAKSSFADQLIDDFLTTDYKDLEEKYKIPAGFFGTAKKNEEAFKEEIWVDGDPTKGYTPEFEKMFTDNLGNSPIYQEKGGEMKSTPFKLNDQRDIYKWIINNANLNDNAKNYFIGEYLAMFKKGNRYAKYN